MSSSAGLGDAACALREQRAVAPRVQILHPEALPALGQQQTPKDFGEKSCLLGLGSSCCRDTNCSALTQMENPSWPPPSQTPSWLGCQDHGEPRAPLGHQVINSAELQTCNDGEDLLETGVVCGMPAGKTSGPHWKGSRAVGPGVGRVARSNQVSYVLIVTDCFTFDRTHLEKAIIKDCL